MSNVQKAVDSLDGLDRKALREVAERLGKLLGVSLDVPVAVPTVVTQGPVVEEKTEFDVVLLAAGPTKINVIKAVREITGLGLKEAKDVVETLPKTVKEQIPKADAELIVSKLRAQGATVEMR